MKAQTELNWQKYLRLFSDENRDRPTRLGVFEGGPPVTEDLWLEDGLPLAGIDIGRGGDAGPEIDILLDNGPTARAHMSHRISAAKLIRITLSEDGEEDGLDIDNQKGERTVLRFERRSIYGGAQ